MGRRSVAIRAGELWPITAATALALGLGLWELGRQSFDLDEGVSAYEASRRLHETLGYVKNQEPNNIL